MIDFKPYIHARQAAWIARRRDFHQHPELGFKEFRTAGIVAEQLTQLGMEVQTGVGQTGVVADLQSPAKHLPEKRSRGKRGSQIVYRIW